MKPAPLAHLFKVLPPGAVARERAGTNQPVLEALTPGILFHGLWYSKTWIWRLPSVGGGYVEAARVQEVK